MRKYLLIVIMAVILVAKPLEAMAWCCKAVLWSTFNVPFIDDKPSNKVKEVQTEQECLDTCEDWKDTAAIAAVALFPTIAPPISAIRLNYHCQNFYRKDASVRSIDAACVSPTLGCCEVTIGETFLLQSEKEVLVFSVNQEPADLQSGQKKSECEYYCNSTADCTSKFYPNANPNKKTHKCEPISPDQTPTVTDPKPGLKVGDYEFTTPTDPLKYAGYNPAKVLAKIINGLLLILGTIALLMFIYAGVLWMTDMGGGSNIKKARSILVWSSAGLLLIFIAYIAVGYLLETFTAI